MNIEEVALVIAGLKYAGPPAAELVKDCVTRVVSPSLDAIGRMLAQPLLDLEQRRIARANDVLIGAAELLVDAGARPQGVPGRVLWPLLQRASVEENDELRRRWKALLANASIVPDAVLPAFVSILGELSPPEARLLQEIYNRSMKYEQHSRRFPPGSAANTAEGGRLGAEILESLRDSQLLQVLDPLEHEGFLVYQANLERLNLVRQGGYAGSTWEADHIDWPIVTTPFGDAFMAACMAPAQRESPAV